MYSEYSFRSVGQTLSVADFPDSVLREAMVVDKNHDGLLDIPEISEALDVLSPSSSDKFNGPNEKAVRGSVEKSKFFNKSSFTVSCV